MRTRLALLALLASAPLLLVGCGGGGEGGSPVVTGPSGTGVFTPAGSTPSGSAPDSTAPGTTAGTVPADPTLTDSSQISTVGLDKVTFGMTVAEAESALGSPLTRDKKGTDACYEVSPERGKQGVRFLVSDGRVERVEVTETGISTRSGAKVGSTEAEITALYGDQIQKQARPDGQPGSWLVFVPRDTADAQYRIVFVTDGATVTAIRSGRVPQVLATTGCG